ncbi:MAG: hypothetical protein H6729_06330 [Deltaproteobacteria bacterium]|nr:hypothetical protein [Deltaproteobacteria bacterium]
MSTEMKPGPWLDKASPEQILDEAVRFGEARMDFGENFEVEMRVGFRRTYLSSPWKRVKRQYFQAGPWAGYGAGTEIHVHEQYDAAFHDVVYRVRKRTRAGHLIEYTSGYSAPQRYWVRPRKVETPVSQASTTPVRERPAENVRVGKGATYRCRVLEWTEPGDVGFCLVGEEVIGRTVVIRAWYCPDAPVRFLRYTRLVEDSMREGDSRISYRGDLQVTDLNVTRPLNGSHVPSYKVVVRGFTLENGEKEKSFEVSQYRNDEIFGGIIEETHVDGRGYRKYRIDRILVVSD